MTVSEKPAKALPGAGALLQEAFRLYVSRFKVFFGYAAWLLIPLVVTIFAFLALEQSVLDVVNIVFNVLLYGVLAAWLTVVTIKITPLVKRKKAIRTRSISLDAWINLIPFLLISILVSLINVLGLALFIVPGIVFATWFAFSVTIVVLERAGVVQSLKQSKALTNGRFFAILWRLIVGALAIGGLYIAGLVVMTTISAVLSGGGVDVLFASEPTVVDEILYRLVEVFLMPLYIIYQTNLYLEAKQSLDNAQKSV